MKRFALTLTFVMILLAAAFAPAAAQEPIVPVPPPIPPEWDFSGLRIEYQRVDVTIAEQVATTHIDQLFVNDNDWILEGTYLFPLPQGAAVSQLTMWINGQPIEAKILEADEARAIYDEIVRQLRDPALLEYVGSSAIQASVFPIPPHEERRIEIEYSQVLPADNGLMHYVYPQSTDLYTNTPLDNQSIRVEVVSDQAIRAIYSPGHQVAISREGDFRAVVGYEAAGVSPDQDFELYYTVSPEDIGLNLLSYKEEGKDGFFLLLAAPGVEVNPEEIVARDVILVVDTSGSMAGEKIEQAKAAALFVLDHLNPEDRYNVIAFSTGARSFTPRLTPKAEGADYASFVNSLEAVGGTNISLALLEAVNQADAERPLTILFLTDGLATEGITETPLLLDAMQDAAPAGTRLFAFGVGHDVDTLLLDSLARNHRGTTTYVRPDEAIDEAVSSFYAKVSTPVLADIALEVDGVTIEQLYPSTLPDLFAGSQLILTGRYRDGGPATITLRGQVNGREQVFTYEDLTFRASGGDDFIPRLWATRAIGHLLQQIRLHGEDLELVESVVNLSIQYGIITPYTSYLIEEDDIFTQSARDEMAEAARQVFEEPAAVSGEAAVETAADQAQMAEAGIPAAAPTLAFSDSGIALEELVKLVGSKTFVRRDGVWVDTAFDPDSTERRPVAFASDEYFDLLTAAPELGQYLAIGSRVLVVHDGLAYEIVAEGQETDVTKPPQEATPLPGGDSSGDSDNQSVPASDLPSVDGGATGFPYLLMAVPMLLLAAMAVIIGRRRAALN